MQVKEDFRSSLMFEEDQEEKFLLEVQSRLEKNGIKKSDVMILAKKLTEKQKKDLIELYKKQIEENKIKIRVYRDRIINIRKRLSNKAS